MALVLVWECDIWPIGDAAGPTTIQNRCRCVLNTAQVHYVAERITGANEPYLLVMMGDAGTANVVDQTLESFVALDRGVPAS